ncbi:MAG: ribonuclease HII [Candidatus Omnitrophota bacterium]
MLYYERKFQKKGYPFIIGVDEVGIGPLAGPVVAAAVLLKSRRFKNRIDDSKKLSYSQREKAFVELSLKAVCGVGIVNEKIIDRLNILEATRIAMEDAVNDLLEKMVSCKQEEMYILVDGTVKPRFTLPFTNIIKGDAKSQSIASASIVAKVTRDRIMQVYDKVFPQYGFLRHKGYPTSEHRKALKEFGASIIHRNSYNCV